MQISNQELVRDLNLTLVSQLDIETNHIRKLFNRIKSFEKQQKLQFNQLGYYPALAEIEIKRMRHMYSIINPNDLLPHNRYITNRKYTKLSIKRELSQLPIIAEHYKSITNLTYFEPEVKLNQVTNQALEELQVQARKARRIQFIWRLKYALEEANYKNWYVIFNTLTINTEHYHRVWEKGSKDFANYIRMWENITNPTNHQYFAVAESGSLNNRKHFHIIHIIKHLPEQALVDPNYSLVIPNHREINYFKKYWQFGYSAPIAVRYSVSDAYGLKKWRWPAIVDSGYVHTPLKVGSPTALASYMAKYISKTLAIKGDIQWKIRHSRQFGLSIINNFVERATRRQLMMLIPLAKMGSLSIKNQVLPQRILIAATTRKIVNLLKSSTSSNTLSTIKARCSIIKQLQNLTKTPTTFNYLNTIDIQTHGSKKTEISRKDILELQLILDSEVIKAIGSIESVKEHILTGSTYER